MNESIEFEVNFLFPAQAWNFGYKDDIDPKDCYASGKYCSVGLIDRNILFSLLVASKVTRFTDLIDEAIRQKCMFKISHHYFFTYVSQYLKHCLPFDAGFEPINIEECAKAAKLSSDSLDPNNTILDENISECYLQSFSNITNKTGSEISIFKQQRDSKSQLYNFRMIPALVIQDYIVRGELNALSMASSICDSMIHPVKEVCSHLTDEKFLEKPGVAPTIDLPRQEEAGSSNSPLLIILLVLVITSIIIVFVIWLAKKLINKGADHQFRKLISGSVAEYYTAGSGRTLQKPAGSLDDSSMSRTIEYTTGESIKATTPSEDL